MKNQISRTQADITLRVKLIAILAILAAASVVLGKFLQIPIGDSIRISFENLPILFAGIVFGPLSGGAVGLVSDLVGCLAVGYQINPVITLGAVSVGFVSGVLARVFIHNGKCSFPRVLLSVLLAHIFGSILLKSTGLRLWYTTPWSVLALRIPIYLINSVAEASIITVLLKSGAVKNALKGFFGGSRKV